MQLFRTSEVRLTLVVFATIFVNPWQGVRAQSAAAPKPDAAMVDDAVKKVKSGEYSAMHVEIIARAKAVQAVPDLEGEFTRKQDTFLKQKIASALVRLGDKNDTYWDYLVQQATPAVDSDMPEYQKFDSEGKSSPGTSPAFDEWAKAHSMSPEEAQQKAAVSLPGAVSQLASTGDPRAIPVLRKALSSSNHMVQIVAAMGLAQAKDEPSVSAIIQACNTAPAEVAAVMARALVYFDDPEAQSVVDKFIPKEQAKLFRDAKAAGHRPF